MATNISIASQALLLLRASPISSFSDGSNEAEIVNELYQGHIESLLALHPWTFATKKRQLNQDSVTPINEYSYSHIIPSETLLLWAVFNTSNVGANPVTDYDIYGTESARRIFSNYSTLYADYVIYPDENVWPAYFSQFAIHSFAAHIAIPVTGSAELANFYYDMAYGSANSNRKGGLYGVAVSQDSKQKRNEYIIDSPLTQARFS